jgi:hypothetical protein
LPLAVEEDFPYISVIHDLPQRRLRGHDDEVAGLGTVNMNGRGDVSVMDKETRP